jgi:hypothetical protein
VAKEDERSGRLVHGGRTPINKVPSVKPPAEERGKTVIPKTPLPENKK